MADGPADAERLEVVFVGRVQGVFFRATTRSLAKGRPVVGWVRNEPDGTVRMVAEGAADELDAFLSAIRDAKAANIDHVRIERGPATGSYQGFTIAR